MLICKRLFIYKTDKFVFQDSTFYVTNSPSRVSPRDGFPIHYQSHSDNRFMLQALTGNIMLIEAVRRVLVLWDKFS